MKELEKLEEDIFLLNGITDPEIRKSFEALPDESELYNCLKNEESETDIIKRLNL